MKDISFALAMNKIVGQAEAERKQEIRAHQRAQTLGRVRGVLGFLCLAALLAVAFNYRDKLTSLIVTKPAAPASATGATATALKGAEDNAAVRDAVIADLGK
jgi:hypothetical protein